MMITIRCGNRGPMAVCDCAKCQVDRECWADLAHVRLELQDDGRIVLTRVPVQLALMMQEHAGCK